MVLNDITIFNVYHASTFNELLVKIFVSFVLLLGPGYFSEVAFVIFKHLVYSFISFFHVFGARCIRLLQLLL